MITQQELTVSPDQTHNLYYVSLQKYGEERLCIPLPEGLLLQSTERMGMMIFLESLLNRCQQS